MTKSKTKIRIEITHKGNFILYLILGVLWAFVAGCTLADPCNHPHHFLAFVLLAISSFIDMLDHTDFYYIEEKDSHKKTKDEKVNKTDNSEII